MPEFNPPPPAWRWRAYQRQCLEVFAGRTVPRLVQGDEAIGTGETPRCWFLLWRRQGGKSSTLAEVSILEMLRGRRRRITYASASLLLGRELIYKEAAVLQAAIPRLQAASTAARVHLETTDSRTGRPLPAKFSSEDFTSLFQAQRLEFRLWHDRHHCARTQVIAPNPATARGWTGTVLLDEFGFIRGLQELWEAVEPIVSTDRSFRLLGATTPPVDDAHFSYSLTEPPPGTEFPVSASGNWYRSTSGKLVHLVDVFDAAEAGVRLYDLDTGRELSPQEHRAQAMDADAWRRNYGIVHLRGGTAAADLHAIESAQAQGHDSARFFQVETDEDWLQVLDWTASALTHGEIGLGWDLATTERERSNPSAVAVLEKLSDEWILRTLTVWKLCDPVLARARVRSLIEQIGRRGLRPRRLCVDSSNERYFAADVRRELSALVPVELVAGHETVQPPGENPIPAKVYLGHRLLRLLHGNQLTLPPEPYVRADFRRVRRDRGSFISDTGPGGEHGDTFDATKLALYALEGSNGRMPESPTAVRVGRVQFQPRTWNSDRAR